MNLLPSVVAAQHAKRIGVQETVFHRGDIVTECAHSNVSILKDGVFYSHPNDEFILRGIAKTHRSKRATAWALQSWKNALRWMTCATPMRSS